ncbi:hypothetical protein ACFQD2_06135 [Pseudomonas lini]
MNKLTKPKAQTVEGIRTEAGLGFERLSMRVSGIECSPIVYVANPGDQALKILTQKEQRIAVRLHRRPLVVAVTV